MSIILTYRIDFNSTWLNITDLVAKNIENCKNNSNKETFPYFGECMLTKTLARFIFWVLIGSSYQNGFNSIWLHITELMPKNIENCKRMQIKKPFDIFVSAYLQTCTSNLSFHCWLFHHTKMVLTQHGLTLLNWYLKTLKTVKKFKQRNVSIFSRVHVYENTLPIYLLIVDYFILPTWF